MWNVESNLEFATLSSKHQVGDVGKSFTWKADKSQLMLLDNEEWPLYIFSFLF